MSVEYMYHSVIPDNRAESYSSFKDVDFTLTFEGRKMLLNTIRFEGDLEVLIDGQNRPGQNQFIHFDKMTGAHSFINNIVTSFEGVGQIENMGSSYNRNVRMVSDATLTAEDCLEADKVCELRSSNENVSVSYCKGVVPLLTSAIAGVNYTKDADFSLKPLFCLNRATDGATLSTRKAQSVSVTVTLARVLDALFGKDVTNATTYAFKNVRMSFMSVPDDGKDEPFSMTVVKCIKTSVLSNQSNLSVKPPSIVDSCYISFQRQSNEKSYYKNSLKTELLPELEELQFLYQNSTNTGITYIMDNQPEMIKRYIEALRSAGHNNVNSRNLKDSNGFGVGISIPGTDLTNKSFNIQIKSKADTATPFNAYIYFTSKVGL